MVTLASGRTVRRPAHRSSLQQRGEQEEKDWVAVKELNLSYHIMDI